MKTTTSKGSALESKFALYWKGVNGPGLTREHRFHPERKWRFDFAHPATRTAIEIEGGSWLRGAHNRGGHFESDCEKYNAAALLGWTVFRLTGAMIRVATLTDISDFIFGKEGK